MSDGASPVPLTWRKDVMAMLITAILDVQCSEGVRRRTRKLCAALAVVVAVAAVPTFFVDGILNGTPVMNGSARGTALTMFALALPVLAVGLVTSTQGSVRGRAALIGALAYLTYNATLLLYATPFNELFLAYVALLGLSLWTLVCALLGPLPLIMPSSRLPARGIAGFILTVVSLNALAWLQFVIPDLGEDPPGFLDGTGLTYQPDLHPGPRRLAARPGDRGRAALAAPTLRRLPRRSRAGLLDDRGDRRCGRPVVRPPRRSHL
jgi:hypothetical protein